MTEEANICSMLVDFEKNNKNKNGYFDHSYVTHVQLPIYRFFTKYDDKNYKDITEILNGINKFKSCKPQYNLFANSLINSFEKISESYGKIQIANSISQEKLILL